MLYSLLAKAINYILKSDPETQAKLSALQGSVVKITLTDWNLDSYILIQEQGVQLSSHYTGTVHTRIRGKLTGLIKAGQSGASGPELFNQGIEISGDAELGEKIRDILRLIDLDPEEYLSHWVGDMAAHEMTWRTKKALEIGRETWRELGENCREFFQVEARYLPTREQVEDFYAQVNRLRDDVDRTAARLDRLEKKQTAKTAPKH